MDNVYPSDHPTDADLLERLLAGETEAHCARCAQRAETIAREMDPLGDEREPFNELFYRRQAGRIRSRIAAGEGRSTGLPRRAWLVGAVAAALVAAVALNGRAPVRYGNRPAEKVTIAAAQGFLSEEDVADDRLLREIDRTLDEDPYDFGPNDG
jgi:hypothetical protein